MTLWECLAAETGAIRSVEHAADVIAGLIPVTAHRPLTAPERAAKTNFADLAGDTNRYAVEHTTRILTDRAVFVALLTTRFRAIANTDGPNAALLWLADVDGPVVARTIDGVRQLVDNATTHHATIIEQAVRQGHARMVTEAVTQGVPAPVAYQVTTADRELISALARRLAQSPLSDVTHRMTTTAYKPHNTAMDVWVQKVADAGLNAPTAGVATDFAKNTAHQAGQYGRGQALQQLPEPANVYASELNDSSTCDSCARVDGTSYASLADAMIDYPIGLGGGFVDCYGGPRCRGTVVAVWSENL